MEREKVIGVFRKVVIFRDAAGVGDTNVTAKYRDPEEYLRECLPNPLGTELANLCRDHKLTWTDVGARRKAN